jgi:Mg-chelatase subunit ChlD
VSEAAVNLVRPGEGFAGEGSAMPDQNYTALLMLVDRSGSMSSIRKDMEGGISELLREQALVPGLLTVDVIRFDDAIEVQSVMAAVEDVKISIDPRGGTALYDAIGLSINGLASNIALLPEHAKPGKVQVVIVTDGEENSSREYTGENVRKLVAAKEKLGWDFVFIGANQDAALSGANIGISADKTLTFGTKSKDIAGAKDALSRYIKDARKGDLKGFTNEERFDANDEGQA